MATIAKLHNGQNGTTCQHSLGNFDFDMKYHNKIARGAMKAVHSPTLLQNLIASLNCDKEL